MRSWAVGFLGMMVLGIAAWCRPSPVPQRPQPPRTTAAEPTHGFPPVPDPGPAMAPLPVPTTPGPPPTPAIPWSDLHELAAHARDLEQTLGRLEEMHVELARHHRVCERTPDPNMLPTIPGLSAAQRHWILQVWGSRDAQVRQHRERIQEIEERHDQAIRRTLTAEQERVYRRGIRRVDY